jgi:ribosomal protein S19
MARSKNKGLFFPLFFFKKSVILTLYCRTAKIPNSFIDKTVQIHTGNRFRLALLTKETLHHRFGELAFTRAFYVPKKKKKAALKKKLLMQLKKKVKKAGKKK